ncbi:MAG: hypothetical protein WCX81_01775 [Monoglobales bacterium]
MKKSNIRDYAVEAFRYYARAEKNKDLKLPTDKRLASGCMLDIIAVEKTLRMLQGSREGNEVIKALRTVYFTMPERGFKKGEISGRVSLASNEISVAEPTIYRFLNKAITLFAQNRGLRISLF